MSDDYLWDKSGTPDPETERLEHLLGRLHHQPQPLDLPPDLPVTTSRRVFFPGLAAAAAVALIAVAVGVWLSWQAGKKETAPPMVATVNATEEKREQGGTAVKPPDATSEKPSQAAPNEKPRHRAPHYQREESQPGIVKASLTEEERAKAQLMLALHIASSKFNLAQKKIQAGDKGVPRS